MGDAGSLFTGFVSSTYFSSRVNLSFNFMLSIFCLRFVKINKAPASFFKVAPAIAFAPIIIPVIDTILDFMLRVLLGRSPFVAANNHLYHHFLNIGFMHMQTTAILLTGNGLFIAVCFFTEHWKWSTDRFPHIPCYNDQLPFLDSFRERKGTGRGIADKNLSEDDSLIVRKTI